MTRRLLSLAVLVLAALSNAPAQQPAPTATIQVRVNRAYDDSDESLRVLGLLLKYVPSRVVPVGAGDTLDQILVDQYGFGKSDIPKTYRLLLDAVLSRNNLAQPEKLLAGRTLNLPIIPRRVLMDWNRLNPRNSVANMSSFSALMSAPAEASANRKPAAPPPPETAATLAFRQPSSGEQLDTSPIELVNFQLPLEPADALESATENSPTPFIKKGYPMPVKLAAESACDTEPAANDRAVLSPEQRATISAALRDHSRRSPVVFVLDTGWPGQAAYDESREAVEDVLTVVWRERFHRTYIRRPSLRRFNPANNPHCRCIERALKELRALDAGLPPARRIRVAYLGMTREQDGGALLADLIQTNELLESLLQTGGIPNDKRVSDSAAWAKTILDLLPERWVGDLVRSDKAVIDAVLGVARAYAKARSTVFFINESWTVDPDSKFVVSYNPPEPGIVLAATGNDPTAAPQNFARRASSSNDTLAIINLTAAGPARDSSLIPPQDIDDAMALGFDGAVAGEIHGTSFAAPRIAWFLAAGEAIRPDPVNHARWAPDLKKLLLASRDPQAAGYTKLLFDPVRYILRQLGLPTPGTNE